MKSYTNLEQSQKLAKILPLESADMFIAYVVNPKEQTHSYNFHILITWGYKNFNELKESNKNKFVQFIPCWSLAKLFEIIPVIIERANNRCQLRMDKSEQDFNIWYEEVDSCLPQFDLDIITPNMVDTCVEMIQKLHNEKLL